MRAMHGSPGPPDQGRRSLALFLTLVTSFLVLLAAPSGSISAAIPVSRPRPLSGTAVKHAQPPFDGEESVHRRLLVKRHNQISSGSVAAGFVHPTHLYRRDAVALPAPDKAYNMTVTQGNISPDGFERLGFLMNGKFPADPFVWDENDDIEITVNNQSPVPFAIHWHGIHQIGSPEMDGVPGLSQWNIYTGQSYTYRFKLINQYGGYWYHSHERGYYADGLRGTIYIRPKANRKKPWSFISTSQDDIDQMEAAEKDFQVMALSDHWHINHTDMLLVVHETGVPPACFDSLHINGRGRQYCVNDWTKVISPIQASLLKNFSSTNPEGLTSKGCVSLVPPKSGYTVKGTLDTRYGGVCQNTTAPLTVFSAAKAISEGRKWLNLQIIDTATNWYYGVSIDSHKMWIVAVDGHYIEPMKVDWAQITIGSRLSVMVELNPDLNGNVFPIRLTGARALQPIEGHAFLSYIDEIDGTWSPGLEEDFGYAMRTLTTAHVPMSGFVTDPSVVKWQQNLSKPFDPISTVPKTSNMTLHAVASQNSLNVWQLATMPLDTVHLADERPMLFNATDGNATSNQMTPYAGIPFGTVVDIIMENNIYSIVGGPNSPHPFHMHSRRFWIIGSGAGPFPSDTVAEAQALGRTFNLDTPPLRDGFDIDSNSWVAIRYLVDHAAANIIHCHIDDHAIEGMAAVLLEGLETIPSGGNFSQSIKSRPSRWVETQNDELGQVLEQSWATGSANAKYVAPAPTETVTPWGDPRSLANSIQLVASSNSVLKSITSSLQSEMSLLQATATQEITAITATVSSDYLTTFTGVPASSSVLTTATATATSQSTLIAAAYTTSIATSSALPTQASDSSLINTVPTTVNSNTPATALVLSLATEPATAPATAPSTVLATASLSGSASAPFNEPASSLTTASATQSVDASLNNTVPQTGTTAASASVPLSLVAYSTLYRTTSGLASTIDIAPSTAQSTSLAVSEETGVAAATRTAASPESSVVDDEPEKTESASVSKTGKETTEETSFGALESSTSNTYAQLTSTTYGTTRSTARVNSVATSTRSTGSTHVYTSLATQQVTSGVAASLNRAASAPLQSTQATGHSAETSVPAPLVTSSAYTTFYVAISLSQMADETSVSAPAVTQSAYTTLYVATPQIQVATTPGFEVATSSPTGTHASTATVSVESTPVEPSSSARVISSATAKAVSSVDEPAYENPVFPSATAIATTSQRVDTLLNVAAHSTTSSLTTTASRTTTESRATTASRSTDASLATATATASEDDDTSLEDEPEETYTYE